MNFNENNTEEIDVLITRFLQGVITGQEMMALRGWITSDITNRDYFKKNYLLWKATAIHDFKKTQIEAAYSHLLVRTSEKRETPLLKNRRWSGKSFSISFLQLTAIVLFAILGGTLIHMLFQKYEALSFSAVAKNVINVPLGSKSKITLPDGSEVFLNAGSRLVYSMNYGLKLREVSLIGEGYFKVAKQQDKPFIVSTSGAKIKAVGTEFNVKAYPDDKMIETILVKGSVVVSKTYGKGHFHIFGNKESVVLHQGQKAQIYKDPEMAGNEVDMIKGKNHLVNEDLDVSAEKNSINLKQSNAEIETSWKDSRWIIQKENLSNLFTLLERRYNVSIGSLDGELLKYRFSGTIQNETLEQVMSIVSLTIPISYKIEKGKVDITLNKKLENKYKRAYEN